MGHIITDLKENFKRGNAFVRLIYINVVIYLLTALLTISFLLFNVHADWIFHWFELPASFTLFLQRPWTIITYMFMHAGIFHLLFNMLWLYWFGSIFLQFFSGKHLRGLYLFGGMAGGALYILAFNIFPYFAVDMEHSVMVGASAAVMAIVAAAAYREPNYPIRLLLLGTVRLKYIALGVVILNLLYLAPDQIGNSANQLGSNAGGYIAHLGGLLAGFWFAASLKKGTDLTAWINKALDWITALFDKKTWKKKPTMKVHYNKNAKEYDYNAHKKAQSDEVDRILDKVKKSGYANLTEEEKKKLFDASKR